jgi:hypothetical protein
MASDLSTLHVQALIDKVGPDLSTLHVQALMTDEETTPPPPQAWYPVYVYLGDVYGWRPTFPRSLFDVNPPAVPDLPPVGPDAPPTFVGSTDHEQSATTNSLSVDVPGGVVDGDLLLLVIASRTNSVNLPAGWSWLVTTDGNLGSAFIGVRTANSEPASYTVTGSSMAGLFTMFAFRDSEVVNQAGRGYDGSGGTEIEVPSMYVTNPQSQVLAVATKRQSVSSFVTPPGFATDYSFSASNASGVVARRAFDAGLAGPFLFDLTGTAATRAGAAVVIRGTP